MKDIVFRTIMLKGASGNDITNIEKTSSSGVVDTYTITLSDGSTETFEVTNGSSISAIEKTATSGLVDTYTVTLTDGSTTTFEVTNGEDAQLYEIPTDGVIGYDSNNAVPDGYEEINSPYDAALSDNSDNAPQTQAVKAALDLKAPLASPSFTGSPTAPTASVGHSGTRIATTAFVNAEIANDTQYHAGDSLDLTPGVFVGRLDSDQKTIHFSIPLTKPFGSDVNTITLGGNFTIYHPSGTTLLSGATLASKGTVTIYKRGDSYGVGVRLVLTTATSATGLVPLAVYANSNNSMVLS